MKFAIAIALLSMVSPAIAVVVASGAANTTAPAGQDYFGNIGAVGGASGIYLGGGWVLTANHVAPSLPATATFGGISYTTVTGSWHRLTNEEPLSTFTDIVLFRLNAPPALPAVTIASSMPIVGADVMMIGRGKTQEITPTNWIRTVNPGANDDTWIEDDDDFNISGFLTDEPRIVRWGVNEVFDNDFSVNVGTVPAPVHVASFSTQFNLDGFVHEAQGVVGDSGGAVFTQVGPDWELAGMMFAVGNHEKQPGGTSTAVDGNLTYIADLSYYRSQILAIIPEPASALLISLAGLFAFVRKR